MTATNISIKEFVGVLNALMADGNNFINLDMVPDLDHPNMNKLIIHAVLHDNNGSSPKKDNSQEILTTSINPDNNEIFNSFNL